MNTPNLIYLDLNVSCSTLPTLQVNAITIKRGILGYVLGGMRVAMGPKVDPSLRKVRPYYFPNRLGDTTVDDVCSKWFGNSCKSFVGTDLISRDMTPRWRPAGIKSSGR
ncbi:hypothetical protein TNCV_2500041 [Trichonephila clavipes]|nr:hypothetical protein TNCV_2500041 [Trichonephila clavipes]